MAWKVTTEPSAEPVSIVDAKKHMRVDDDSEHVLLQTYLVAARKSAEEFQRRKYITQSITLELPGFSDVMSLPCAPLQSVTSVKYIDTDGVQQTLAASFYDVDTVSEPGRVLLAYEQTWPTARSVYNAIEIIYVVGYGATSGTVPEQFRVAIWQLAAHAFENREPIAFGGSLAQIPLHGLDLLRPSRRRPNNTRGHRWC